MNLNQALLVRSDEDKFNGIYAVDLDGKLEICSAEF